MRRLGAEVPAVLRALLRKSHAPLHAGLDYSFHANIPTLCNLSDSTTEPPALQAEKGKWQKNVCSLGITVCRDQKRKNV